jgi:hypothetical protein
MKTYSHWRTTPRKVSLIVSRCTVAAGWLLLSATVLAAPRQPWPPLPDGGLLHKECFDQPFWASSSQWPDPSVWVESWSGYALNRSSQQAQVTLWVVPMLATNGNSNVDPQRGALRLWYQPDSGLGNGNPATLLTLVSSAPNTAAVVWWSLVVSGDGQSVVVTCEGANGPSACLSVPVSFEAGAWYLLTLAYTETNTVLYLNDQVVATGFGLLTVPDQVAPLTSLVAGSRLSGDLVACGEIDELAAFTSRGDEESGWVFDPSWSVAHHYAVYSPHAALGPVSNAELAAEEQATEQQAGGGRVGRLMTLLENSSMNLPTLDPESGCCGTNAFDEVWVANMVVWPGEESGWNTALAIGGGTNGALYDVFRTSALSTDSVTNWAWVWLTNAYACDTVTLTEEPEGAFYLLGTPRDSDEDGLPDAFEWLISHSDPNTIYTRGDGIDDRTAYLQGRNPRVPGSSPDTGGVIHLQVYTPLN